MSQLLNKQAQKKAQQRKRQVEQQGNDSPGDVDMPEQRSRGERGGARISRRKRRREGLGEIDMASAEVQYVSAMSRDLISSQASWLCGSCARAVKKIESLFLSCDVMM